MKPTTGNPPGGDDRPDVRGVVAHLFRRESGRLVAILTRRLGADNLPLAEDVVQDALVRAMEVWPFSGIPQNPSAWLLQAARNRAFDVLRRNRTLRAKTGTLGPLIEDCAADALAVPAPQFEDEIADAQLRMMFVCCHPSLPAEAQIALVLKTLCGFGETEIASAFLTHETAVAKRLVRARQTLREARISTDLPPAGKLAPRVTVVLHALYLLFNEGYKASHGDGLLRQDLCDEAIRLGELLVTQPLGDRPDGHALLALMHFHAARLPARTRDDGSLLVLAEQDRSRWNRTEIGLGIRHLDQATSGDHLTRWHLEAGIAAAHVLAPSFAETDWQHILDLYDALLATDPSPIVALNRTIAYAQVHGASEALEMLEKIPNRRRLAEYYLFHAVRGQLLANAGRGAEAVAAFRKALSFSFPSVERDLLAERITSLERRPAAKAPAD